MYLLYVIVISLLLCYFPFYWLMSLYSFCTAHFFHQDKFLVCVILILIIIISLFVKHFLCQSWTSWVRRSGYLKNISDQSRFHFIYFLTTLVNVRMTERANQIKEGGASVVTW